MEDMLITDEVMVETRIDRRQPEPYELVRINPCNRRRDGFDEGLDWDEAGAGGISVDIVDSSATGNADEAVKISEEDDGDLEVMATQLIANESGDAAGITAEETGPGDVGIELEQLTASGNAESGVEIDERDAGTVTAGLMDSALTDNGGFGLIVGQEQEPRGTVTLVDVAISGNGDGEVELDGVDRE